MLLIALSSLVACAPREISTVEVITDSMADLDSAPYVYQPIVVTRSSSSELQILSRLAKAIEELEALIREAESSADPDARIRFDYYQLRSDMLSITQGIQAHVRTPVYMPRTLDPIVGNYGR